MHLFLSYKHQQLSSSLPKYMRKIMRLDLQYTKRLVLLNENLPLRFKSDLQVLSETIMSPNLQKSVLSTNGSI